MSLNNVCTYITRGGESLQALSITYQTTQQAIFFANQQQLQNVSLQSLPGGLSLQIPTPLLVCPVTPVCPICPPCPGQATTSCVYFVQPGDTITSIALFLTSLSTITVTPQQLAQANNLNVNSVLQVGLELIIPNCTNPLANNCGQLLQDARQYLSSLGLTNSSVTIGYAESGTILIPVLVVTNVPTINLFPNPPANTYLLPINQNQFPLEASNIPIGLSYNIYSLESVEDFLTARNPSRVYRCAGILTYQARVERLGCTSITVLFSQAFQTQNLTSYGVRNGLTQDIVLRVTIPAGIQLPPVYNQLLQLQSSRPGSIVVVRSNPPTTGFPQGSTTILVSFDLFALYLLDNGENYCEAEGSGPLPDEGTCQSIVDEILIVLEPLYPNARAALGAVRGRNTSRSIGPYNPSNFVVPVILVNIPNISPFMNKRVAGVSLLPLSTDNYELVAQGFSAPVPNLNQISMFDLASIIGFLAADTNFNSQCAAILSRLWNYNRCPVIFDILEDPTEFGPENPLRQPTLSASYETIVMRKVFPPDFDPPGWVYSIGGDLTLRKASGVDINSTLNIPVANLLRYLQLSGQGICLTTGINTFFGTGGVAILTNTQIQQGNQAIILTNGETFLGTNGNEFVVVSSENNILSAGENANNFLINGNGTGLLSGLNGNGTGLLSGLNGNGTGLLSGLNGNGTGLNGNGTGLLSGLNGNGVGTIQGPNGQTCVPVYSNSGSLESYFCSFTN